MPSPASLLRGLACASRASRRLPHDGHEGHARAGAKIRAYTYNFELHFTPVRPSCTVSVLRAALAPLMRASRVIKSAYGNPYKCTLSKPHFLPDQLRTTTLAFRATATKIHGARTRTTTRSARRPRANAFQKINVVADRSEQAPKGRTPHVCSRRVRRHNPHAARQRRLAHAHARRVARVAARGGSLQSPATRGRLGGRCLRGPSTASGAGIGLAASVTSAVVLTPLAVLAAIAVASVVGGGIGAFLGLRKAREMRTRRCRAIRHILALHEAGRGHSARFWDLCQSEANRWLGDHAIDVATCLTALSGI